VNGEDASFNVYSYVVSVRLRHPSCDPSEFTAALGLTPTIAVTAGQPRVRHGKTLAAVSRETWWVHEFAPDTGLGFEQFLMAWSERLSVHEAFFRRLSADGGKADLFVGFFMESNACGLELPASLMGRCAALGLELRICLYGPDSPQASEGTRSPGP
jgi:Domain of unknown function (DUF4279)